MKNSITNIINHTINKVETHTILLLNLIILICTLSCRGSEIYNKTDIKAIGSLMNEYIGTFDSFDNTVISEEENNLTLLNNGWYYGNYEIIESKLSFEFPDGYHIMASKALRIGNSNITESIFTKSRLVAGITIIKDSDNLYGFNNYVPGTFMAVVSSSSEEDGTCCINFQQKGKNADYVCSKSEIITESYPQLVSLHGDFMGSFWITSKGKSLIHAIRFIPDYTINIVQERQIPQFIKKTETGYFIDFGKDAFGQIDLSLECFSENDTVKVLLGECMKNYSVDENPGGSRRFYSVNIPLKKGLNTYSPQMQWNLYNSDWESLLMPVDIGEVMPFRYCEIQGYNGLLTDNDIVRNAYHHEFNDEASYFHCDNEVLNEIWDLCKYSMKATSFMGYYIDGDRERSPYEADALINQLSHFACDNNYSISHRTIDYLLANPTWPTEWLMQTIILIWNHYLFTGDDSIIRNNLELIENHALKAFIDDQIGLIKTTNIQENDLRLKKLNRIGSIRDIVDWPQDDEDKEFDFVFTDYNAVVNAYHYYVSCLLAKIYKLMDMDEKHHEWDAYSSNLKHIYNNNFLDRTKGLYRDGLMKDTQHCSIYPNMFALCFGLVPDEYKNNIARYVSDQGLKCSVFNAQFLLQALFMNNHQQEAIDLITNTGLRSWINMINEGSTITTEAWSSEIKPNQDWNHAWGAAPANLIQFYLMGIRPIDVGFNKAIIQPRLGDLKTASCKLPTKHGGIELSINRELEYFDMLVSIPEDISCDIIIPYQNNSYSELLLDGLKCTDFEKTEEGLILYDLNGSHRITLSQGNNKSELIKDAQNHNIYNINGIKITENNNGIIIHSKKKFILKK